MGAEAVRRILEKRDPELGAWIEFCSGIGAFVVLGFDA